MKKALSVLGICVLLSLPARAQDDPPDQPDPGPPSTAPAPPPGPQGGFRAGRRMRVHRLDSVVNVPGIGLGTWWRNSDVVSKLQLSDDQVKKIEAAYYNHRLKLVDLRADLEKQELQLSPLLDADQPDEAKVAAQIDQVTMARGRLEKEHAMMMLGMRRVLTVDQWKKLQAMRDERRSEMGVRRRGLGLGPGPGRGPGPGPGGPPI
ncbi:MAG: Spy/CpxP family protein refolding chaperone [Terriglobia bacterium]